MLNRLLLASLRWLSIMQTHSLGQRTFAIQIRISPRVFLVIFDQRIGWSRSIFKLLFTGKGDKNNRGRAP